ncbi:MAG TPA: dienelactone hydrolase family protein [Caulobacteraceae bacterium]|jgi:dienelactone hydrolase
MIAKDIEYSVAGARYVGKFFADDAVSGKRPGVLVAPEGGGLVDLTKSIARRLAEAGFAAFAMDYYGDGQPLSDMNDVMARLGPWMADPSGIRAIAAAALDVLTAQPQTDPERLAATGYCFGGTTALELGRSGAPLKAIVGFHSGLGTARPGDASAIKAKVQVNIGVDDPIIPPDQRTAFEKEMNSAHVDWRMILYGGVGHSFTNPDVGALGRPGFAYDALADRRSWAAMMDLFGEVFG